MSIFPNEDEKRILYKAVDDFQKYGKTEIVCPRCGKLLKFVGGDISWGIYCEDKQCIGFSCRGI